MFLAIDHMRQVRTRALSPDRTVTATMTAEGGLNVHIEPAELHRHSVDSLSRQTRAAVSGVLDAYHKAGDAIVRRELSPGALDEAWETDAGRRLRPFVEALDRLDVTGVGPRGLAKVGLVDGRFRVAFRPKALRLRAAEVSAEVEAAVAAMHGRRSTEAIRLYEELVTGERTPT